MRAFAGRPGGGIDAAELIEMPDPTPAAGQIRVAVAAAALNPGDLKVLGWRGGASFLHKKVTPLVVGYDFAGTIDQLGPGVSGHKVGDAVFGFVPWSPSTALGTLADKTLVSAATVAALPPGLAPEQGAALATAGCTALQGMRDVGRVEKGQRVLVNGASGGVGLLAVQIARELGAEVWGTASAAKLDAVNEAGAHQAIDYRTTPLGSIQAKFDLVYDAASTSSFAECSPLLVDGGRYLTLLPSPAWLWGKLSSLFSSKRSDFLAVKANASDLSWLANHAVAGTVTARIEARFPFAETRAALKLLETGKTAGKIVVLMA